MYFFLLVHALTSMNPCNVDCSFAMAGWKCLYCARLGESACIWCESCLQKPLLLEYHLVRYPSVSVVFTLILCVPGMWYVMVFCVRGEVDQTGEYGYPFIWNVNKKTGLEVDIGSWDVILLTRSLATSTLVPSRLSTIETQLFYSMVLLGNNEMWKGRRQPVGFEWKRGTRKGELRSYISTDSRGRSGFRSHPPTPSSSLPEKTERVAFEREKKNLFRKLNTHGRCLLIKCSGCKSSNCCNNVTDIAKGICNKVAMWRRWLPLPLLRFFPQVMRGSLF